MIALALRSLQARRLTVGLTLTAIAISIALLLGVERIQSQTKQSFLKAVSGTDMIVGARTGPLNLLLYSVFRLGQPTHVMNWSSYEELRHHPAVAWSIPFSLGDSHRGYRVLGTHLDYFNYYQYSGDQQLELQSGQLFQSPFDVVLGAQVAKNLGYPIGHEMFLAHGVGDVSFAKHENLPFRVTGILKMTGTPVDKTVHIPLEGISAVHIGWNENRPKPRTTEEALAFDLTPTEITGFFVGLKSPISAFAYQRFVQTFKQEPLSAILPGAALQELWSMMSVAEIALRWIAACVVLAGFLGMLTTQLASLQERRREMAILRSIGASPMRLFFLLLLEAFIMTGLGVIFGVLCLYGVLKFFGPWIQNEYGLIFSFQGLSLHEWQWLTAVICVGSLVGLIPALRVYFLSLSDGMKLRV